MTEPTQNTSNAHNTPAHRVDPRRPRPHRRAGDMPTAPSIALTRPVDGTRSNLSVAPPIVAPKVQPIENDPPRRQSQRGSRKTKQAEGTVQVQQCSEAVDLTASEITRKLASGAFILTETPSVVGLLASPMHRRTITQLDMLLDHASFAYSVKIPDIKRAAQWVDFTAVDFSILDLLPAQPITLVSPCGVAMTRTLAAALHAPNPDRIGIQVYGTQEEHRISAAASIPLISAAVPAGSSAAVDIDVAIDALRHLAALTGVSANIVVVKSSVKSSGRPSTVIESVRRRRDLDMPFIVHRPGDLDLKQVARAANTIYTPRVFDGWT